MNKDLKLLKAAIKRETDKLICESHPGVCGLRDSNYSRLEELVMADVLAEHKNESRSIQSILAELEREI